jgi:hypothetical protein
VCQGIVKKFAGATCIHWTTNNTTEQTRVSLDFRLICQRFYNVTASSTTEVETTNGHNKNQIDDSYYSVCQKVKHVNSNGSSTWRKRDGPTKLPDARMGYPWTLKTWDHMFETTKNTM